jgi:hypothetical protein
MKHLMRGVVLFMTVLSMRVWADPAAAQQSAPTKSFAMPGGGTIFLNVPQAWTQTHHPGAGKILNLEFTTQGADACSVQIAVVDVPPAHRDALKPDKLKQLTEVTAQQYLATSEEKKLDLQEIHGDATSGYYYSLTDGSSDPGPYKMVTGASVAVGGEVLLGVTVMHQKDSENQKLAIQMLKTAILKPAPAASQPATQPAANNTPSLKFAAPGGKWNLLLANPLGLTVGGTDQSPDGKSNQSMAVSDIGWMATIFIEPGNAPTNDARNVREFYLNRMKQNPLEMKDIKFAGDASVARVEYVQSDGNFEQKNFNIYAVHQGMWIDIHLSKADYNETTDRASIEQVTKGVRFETSQTTH